MNGWLAAAALLLTGGVGPSLWHAARGGPGRRVVAQNYATLLLCLVFLLLAQGYGRPAYADLALVVSVLGPAGTLVFARLLLADAEREPPGTRWLTPVLTGGTAATVLPLCVVTGPGRATAKLLVIAVLLSSGGVATIRAVRRG
ncbi:MrpF/PhaF family protein [Streptomyces sp. UNOB3_S3]|uniref:MrpF/PhaF family protein n=1 Tax=Streptomyces sp. UNOB3_S3 TaxID=2871682 RepID=UPI001E41C959|nr:MrpF/PhaF family protein [Streptomyces sp. UNOB3_S3]MCC3773831.1 MrpF/PhaF family protein [Streptomyces sp. UNOB3_S3]